MKGSLKKITGYSLELIIMVHKAQPEGFRDQHGDHERLSMLARVVNGTLGHYS